MPKLKVFRTTIGFHDAYVAAPSRAAAQTTKRRQSERRKNEKIARLREARDTADATYREEIDRWRARDA